MPITDEERSLNLDVRKLFGAIIAKWRWIALSLFLALLIAFLFNRYKTPVYESKATLLIKDKNNQTPNSLISGLDMLNFSRNIENEIGLLKTQTLLENALLKTDFGVYYYIKARVKQIEIYGDCPIQVEVDSSKAQLINTTFTVSVVNDQTFTLDVEGDAAQAYLIASKETLPNFELDLENIKGKTFKFGEWIEAPFLRLRIWPNTKLKAQKEREICFRLLTLDQLVGTFGGVAQMNGVNKNASLLEITGRYTNPRKLATFINTLATTAIENGLEEKNLISANTLTFIDEQLKMITDSLLGVENQLQQFRSVNKIMDLSAEGQLAFEQLKRIEEEKGNALLQEKYMNYLFDYVKKPGQDFKDFVVPSVIGISDPMLNTLLNNLLELTYQKNAMSFTAIERKDNMAVAELNQKLETAKISLLQNLASLKETNDILQKDIAFRAEKVESILGALPQKERDYVKIKRLFALNENLYIFLSQKRAEVGIAKAANIPDNIIIDKARPRVGPVAPRKIMNYLIAGGLGFLLPVITIVLFALIDTRINTKPDLESATKIPFLGAVGHSKKNTNLVVQQFPKSEVAESFRSLRANLQYLKPNTDKMLVLITSSVAGEGKTFCAINLAGILALSDKKTLLMGIDLRKPKLQEAFAEGSNPGLTNFLVGKATKEQIISKTQFDNLDVIFSGPVPPNPSELLLQDRFTHLIESLKSEYDYIIFDTPPLGLVADAIGLMDYADLTLYVVRQGFTRTAFLDNINDLHTNGKVKNISVVLNDFQLKNAYGYRYGYGYGYGSGYYE